MPVPSRDYLPKPYDWMGHQYVPDVTFDPATGKFESVSPRMKEKPGEPIKIDDLIRSQRESERRAKERADLMKKYMDPFGRTRAFRWKASIKGTGREVEGIMHIGMEEINSGQLTMVAKARILPEIAVEIADSMATGPHAVVTLSGRPLGKIRLPNKFHDRSHMDEAFSFHFPSASPDFADERERIYKARQYVLEQVEVYLTDLEYEEELKRRSDDYAMGRVKAQMKSSLADSMERLREDLRAMGLPEAPQAPAKPEKAEEPFKNVAEHGWNTATFQNVAMRGNSGRIRRMESEGKVIG